MALDVATDATHLLTRAQWWDSVHDALDEMTVEVAADHRSEALKLDGTTADGLDASCADPPPT